MTIETSTLQVLAVVGLLAFGVGYNMLTARVEKLDQAYTSILVVGGVLVTLAVSVVFIGVVPALIVGACFVLSGLPMTIGSMHRYLTRHGETGRDLTDHDRALEIIKAAQEAAKQ